jgi:hypothetical protein
LQALLLTRSLRTPRSLTGICRAMVVFSARADPLTIMSSMMRVHSGEHYSCFSDIGWMLTCYIPSADGLQSLSFALCHVYARSTRSVSIPAPVYCKSIPNVYVEDLADLYMCIRCRYRLFACQEPLRPSRDRRLLGNCYSA